MKKVAFKDIADISSGSTAPKDSYFSETGLPFIRAGHLQKLVDGFPLSNLPKIKTEYSNELKLKKVTHGTIIFAKSGMSSTKNRIYKSCGDAYIVNHLAAINPNENKVDSEYLKYFLQWFNPSRLIIDESYPSIRLSDISNIRLNLVNISEQKKIASILSKGQNLVRLRKAQIKALSNLSQSIFLKMFGDPVSNEKNYKKVPLKELGHIQTGNTPSRKVKEYYGDYIEWIKSDNINTPSDFLTRAEEYLSEKGMGKARVAPAGSILITCIAGSFDCIGNAAITNRDVTFNQQINSITPKEEVVDTYFLYNLFKVGKKLVQQASTNSMKGMVSKSNFQEIMFILPDIKDQKTFKDIYLKIEAQKVQIEKSLIQLENNFNSLMQSAFEGVLFSN